MLELFDWFRSEAGGVGSYEQLCERALALVSMNAEHAATLRVLADIASKFVFAFDDQPLSSAIADASFAKMLNLFELVEASLGAPAAERFRVLNYIAGQDLV